MYTVTKEFEFCAAHRLEGHPKCGRLHGHNYRVVVSVSEASLTNGMVIDYNALSRIVKPIVDEIDHKYIVSNSNIMGDDPYSEIAIEKGHAFLLDAFASTAECLAAYFVDCLKKVVKGKITVTVSETPKTTATFETDDEPS